MATSYRVQVILRPELEETLRILAKVRKRSVSNMASILIEEALESEEVQNDVKVSQLRDQIANEKVRSALEGANLSHDKILRVTQILLGEDESV